MREKYESLSLSVLRDVAKNRGIKGTSSMRKDAVIEAMLAEDERTTAAEMVKSQAAEVSAKNEIAEKEQADAVNKAGEELVEDIAEKLEIPCFVQWKA